jgi:hypothetical protein
MQFVGREGYEEAGLGLQRGAHFSHACSFFSGFPFWAPGTHSQNRARQTFLSSSAVNRTKGQPHCDRVAKPWRVNNVTIL